MYEIKWIRQMIRRRMAPVDQSVAEKWKKRFAIAYGIIAWNAFGLVLYHWYNGKRDWAEYYGLKSEEDLKMTNREYFARNLGQEGATVRLMSIKNWSVVDDGEYVLKKSDAPSESKTNFLDLEASKTKHKDLPVLLSKQRND